mgnify:CR=1 FL=1
MYPRRQVPGSNAFVPAAAGLIIAGEVVRDIANGEPQKNSSTTPIENVRENKMLRKGEQRSPTEVCHVYDINVRCYVKAWGAQCAPLCSQQNF